MLRMESHVVSIGNRITEEPAQNEIMTMDPLEGSKELHGKVLSSVIKNALPRTRRRPPPFLKKYLCGNLCNCLVTS